MTRWVRPFAPQRPREQAPDHLVDRRLPRQQRADRGDDRHVDAERIGGALQHRRGEGAFGHGPAVGEQVGGARAFADALAEAEVARAGRRAGEDEVAEPGQARQRLRARALGEAEAGHLGEAARNQRGAGVQPEPAPSTTPQAMASTFLTAPPTSAPATSSDR